MLSSSLPSNNASPSHGVGSLFLPHPVAVLYQTTAVAGLVKPLKPGGYFDSSADVAAGLLRLGVPVTLPTAASSHPTSEFDLIFGDDAHSIQRAIASGARVLWANTVLHERHALMGLQGAGDLRVVGHAPRVVQRVDNKFLTNALLASHVPIARSLLVGSSPTTYRGHAVLSADALLSTPLPFPLPCMAKPVRGRGSQGVALCPDAASLLTHVRSLLAQPAVYGALVMVEERLPGEEVTITVMPPGHYSPPVGPQSRQWTLPAVRRTGHVAGLAPYSGVVAVTVNSAAAESTDATYDVIRAHCAVIGEVLGALKVMRVDCRANAKGEFAAFDVNLNPNMTGRGRVGRENQSSLVGLAAAGVGWSYEVLLQNILAGAPALSTLQNTP